MSELFAKPYKLAEVATALLDDFTADAGTVIAAINGIEQTELKTDLMAVSTRLFLSCLLTMRIAAYC